MSRHVSENLVDTGHPKDVGVEIDEGILSGRLVVNYLRVEGIWMVVLAVYLDLGLDLISRNVDGFRLYVLGFW